MDSFILIYFGMLAIGLMLWATALMAEKSKGTSGGLRDIPRTYNHAPHSKIVRVRLQCMAQ
jgi:hypothetical protein